MTTDTKIILGSVLGSALIIAASIVFIGKNEAGSPQSKDLGVGSMTIDKLKEDFGDMKVDDEKTATFTITNTSTDSTLRIWNVSTSCNCTFASVEINGVATGEFNMPMHTSASLKNWIGEIPANQKALLKATYKPKVMPVTGPVTRSVTFSTNDPKYKNVQVDVSANVL